MSEYIGEYVVSLTAKTFTDLRFHRHEEIVRCRDCVNYKPYKTYRHGTMNRCYDESGNTHRRDENDFCSLGERKTDAHAERLRGEGDGK